MLYGKWYGDIHRLLVEIFIAAEGLPLTLRG